ncbi:MAG: MBL fold metallo-hydrolase, partial [Bacteroidota bacterium]
MQIGPYTLRILDTGPLALDGGAMFGVVPRVLWERSHPPDSLNRIAMVSRVLLISAPGRKILIDTGSGTKLTSRAADIYGVDRCRSDLRRVLRDAGTDPEEVTDVVLTHLHFDHAGGGTVREGGEAVPAFPRAAYHVQREQWNAALHPTERDRASYLPEDFLPLDRHGRLALLDGEGELFPGIHIRVFHGHTAAMQCPVVSDGRTTLVHAADLIPMTGHIRLPWIMAYDLQPLVTLREKKALLAEACEKEWMLFFQHDPRLSGAYVSEGEGGVELRPVP